MPASRFTQIALLGLCALTLARDGPARMHDTRAKLQHVVRGPQIIAPLSVPGAQAGTNAPAATSTQQQQQATTTTPLLPISVVPVTVTSTTSSTTSPVAVVVVTSSTTPTSTAQPTTRAVTVTSSRELSVINLTLTSIISASSAASASAAAASSSATLDSSSGGIGQGTVIAIVVVASSVGGVFLLWTVFRRWKLKPSRNFGDRMQPIDFGVGAGGGEKDYGSAKPGTYTLNRSGSRGSEGSTGSQRGLYRRDSFGSAADSQRAGAESDIGSQRAFQAAYPPGSQSNSQWGAAPAYSPPSIAPSNAYGQEMRLANPYGGVEYDYAGSEPGGMAHSESARYGDGQTWQHRF